jgi:hypothetical protein
VIQVLSEVLDNIFIKTPDVSNETLVLRAKVRLSPPLLFAILKFGYEKKR